MLTRKQALDLVQEKIKNFNLIKHCLAVEAVMRDLALKLGQDQEKWGLAGLLHDIDYEETKDDPQKHSLRASEILKDLDLDSDIIQAVKVHNEIHCIPCQSLLDKALFCVDPLTGLIIAACLILPDKKLTSLSVESVLKRFQEKRFAAGASREIIQKCEEFLGLSLEEFIKISLQAMRTIALDLGL